jgi:hypothetical protein
MGGAWRPRSMRASYEGSPQVWFFLVSGRSSATPPRRDSACSHSSRCPGLARTVPGTRLKVAGPARHSSIENSRSGGSKAFALTAVRPPSYIKNDMWNSKIGVFFGRGLENHGRRRGARSHPELQAGVKGLRGCALEMACPRASEGRSRGARRPLRIVLEG